MFFVIMLALSSSILVVTNSFCCAHDPEQNLVMVDEEYPELPDDSVMGFFDKAIFYFSSQESNDRLLMKALKPIACKEAYLEQRKVIAALIEAGADVVAVQDRLSSTAISMLPSLVLKGDVPLVRFILQQIVDGKKVNIHERDFKGDVALCGAMTVKMAQLLIDNGALNDLQEQDKRQIFKHAMWEQWDHALVKLYRKHGFDPMSSSNNMNLIMHLAGSAYQDMVAKAKPLFDRLLGGQIATLINATIGSNKRTVFDIIASTKERMQPKDCARIDTFNEFLLQIKDDLERGCSVCFEDMSAQACVVTDCGHIFDEVCLKDWHSRNKEKNCPKCRMIIPEVD